MTTACKEVTFPKERLLSFFNRSYEALRKRGFPHRPAEDKARQATYKFFNEKGMKPQSIALELHKARREEKGVE